MIKSIRQVTFAILLLLTLNTWATTVTYTGGASVTCPAVPPSTWTGTPTGLTIGSWTRGSGVSCASATNGINGSGFTATSAASSNNEYYSITLSAATGYNVTLTGITWLTTASGSVTSCDFDVEYNNNGGGITTFGTTGNSLTSNSYTGSVTIASGTSLVLYFIPWKCNASGGTLRFINNSTLTVTAAPIYAITVTQGSNGAISPGTTSVSSGGSQAFTATPNSCYSLSTWTVDGSGAGNSNPYTFTNVTATHTITATYALLTYGITASAGANGSVTPSGTTNANCGGSQAYTVTPNSGFAVQSVLVDGVSQGAITSYTFSSVAATHTISATFVSVGGPTITTTPASFGGPFCNNATHGISAAFSSTGTLTGTFYVQISDANGNFTNTTNTGDVTLIGSGTSSISATIPSGLATGSGYKVRVINSNPWTYGTDNGTAFTINASPATPTFTTATGTNNNLTPCDVSNNYTINAQAGYTYAWAVPSGWGTVTGGNTNQITVVPSLASGMVTASVSIAGCTASSASLSVTPLTTPSDVTSQGTSGCTSGGTTVSWTNPSCFDGVIVVANQGSSVSFSPGGSSYTGNNVYAAGNQVVYAGTGATVTVSGLSNGQQYTYKIYTRIGTTWSTGATATCTPTAPAYCTAGSGGGTQYISDVVFGSINNSSGNTTYSNFTSRSTSIQQSQTYPITVTDGSTFTGDYVDVYIDYNQNGVFTDVGEHVFSSGGATVNSGTFNFTGNITVPSTATLGSTGMRVRLQNTASSANSCGNSNYGEVEDYTVNIAVAGPGLSTSALASFGTTCAGTIGGPNSFTITGGLLTSANVTVGALSGFTFSTTSGGAYTSNLSLAQSGGSYSQQIFVKFSPVAGQSYSGNIPVGGGGASSINVAATGIGSGPSISAATSNGPVCTGSSLNLTVNGSGFSTYQWADPNAATSGQVYYQDFNSLPSSSSVIWVDNSTLPGWYIYNNNLGADGLVAGTGSSNTGDSYSFGTSSANRALGSVASGSTSTIYYGVNLTNNTGGAVNKIFVQYTGEQWRDGGSTAVQNTLAFSYSTSATAINTGTYNTLTGNPLDFLSPIMSGSPGALNGALAANQAVLSATISLATPLANGASVWLRWKDIDDTGADMGLAVDNLTVIMYSSGSTMLAVPSASVNTSTVSTLTGYITASTYTSASATVGGTYTVTATDNNGCDATSTISVGVTPSVSSLAFTLGSTSVRCQGASSVTYGATASNTTGITYSDATTLAFTGNSIVAGTGAVTYAAGWSGTSIITASATGCNGPITAIHTVTVTATVGAPTAITIASGSDPICELLNGTTTTTYSTTATNNTGFNWNIDNGAAGSINASSGVMSWANNFTGTVTIRVTANGCNGPSSSVNHIVTNLPYITPSVSIDPTPNYIVCSNSTINFTATPSGDGNVTPTYQWKINGVSVGSNSATYTDNAPADGAIVTCVMTSNYVCPSPATITSNPTTMVVGVCNNIWNPVGTSTNWDDANNWSAIPHHVPSSCADEANFPPGQASYPILTQNEFVGSVLIQPGATINLSTHNLSVCGNWTVTASTTISSAGGVIIFDGIAGGATQTLTGTTNAYEINVNTAATGGVVLGAGANVSVANALDLQQGNINVGTNQFTFKSTGVSQSAILDNFTPGNTGTISGSVNAERYYSVSNYPYTRQHMLGSPVGAIPLSQFGAGSSSGPVIAQSDCDENNVAINSPYGNVFSLRENNPGASTCGVATWYVEAGGTPATIGQGYSVVFPASGTLTVTGLPNVATSYTVSGLTNSNWVNHTHQHHTLSSGWQLMSNPYLATLQINNTSGSGIDGQVQVWQANGSFVGTYQPGVGNIAPAIIAPFQAFMVHVTSPGTGSYTISGSDRKRTPATFYAQNANELDILAENLSTNLMDKTVVAFNSAATDSFDTQFDANKIAGSDSRHTIYSVNNDAWMAINTLHDVSTTSTVPVGFEPGISGNYSLAFNNVSSFDPTTYIVLEDKQQKIMYNVRNGNYQFSSDTADNWDRFVLHFTPPAVFNTTDATCNAQGTISVTQPGAANWNYTLTDGSNTVIASGTLNQNSPLNINAAVGTYTLTMTDNNNYTVTKVIQLNGVQPVAAAFNASSVNVTTQTAVNFTNNSQNANTYSWNFGDGTTSNLVSPVHTYSAPGVYTVDLTATNTTGCTATSNQTITVTNSTTAINNIATENGISLWSNKNKVYVDFSGAGSEVDAVIKIYDVLGQEISEEKYTLNGLYQKEIDNIEAAYVIVSVRNNDKVTTRKLFINNIAK